MNLRPPTPCIVALAPCMLVAATLAIGQDDPIELGLEEQVDVEFILVDFLVVDGKGRTVPGLTVDDFELLVDHKPTEIASLDLDCPVGAARDPKAGSRRTGDAAATALPRRIVLVFDYDHMANPTQTFDAVLDMLDRRPVGDEEHMIASLGSVVRIESPFTTDLDELRWTVRRMRNDRDLYAGFRGRVTELRFFERIKALFDILERWPGRKSIVLFSGAFEGDGFFHDPQHRELSALATTTRTAVYPVDTGGLRTGSAPRAGPATLARLAVETGGRATSNTNDLSMGYARAHRDLGCTYTLGFHDPRPRPDKAHRLLLRVKDRRYRVVYPDFYVVRSPEAKRQSILRTAALAPHMFESEYVNAELFVVGPASFERWRTVVGIEVRLAPGEEVDDGATWDMRGTLRKPNGTIVRSFQRRVPVWRLGGTTSDAVVTLFQEIVAPPGDYVLSVVVSDPDKGTPRAASRQINLTKVPRRGSFVLGPILGHRSETATKADRADPTFRPLITPSTERGQDLESLTVVCVRGQDVADGNRPVARWITTLDGRDVHRFDEAQVNLIGRDKVHCEQLVDTLSTNALEPGRYEINAVVEMMEYTTETGSTEFAVDLPGGSDR